ncbi:hypothetical protein DRO58_01710 [Candidatus Bathyarchaeota archaeon]|nr:MAG: hypothetical protein DRO58_01710 [Candidatus Bathyarchaeota archaeon]
MKLSAVYALPGTARFDYVLRGELEEVLGFMAELGYHGVEYNIPDPFKLDFGRLLEATEAYGLRVSAISTGLAYLEYGLSLTHPDRSVRDKAVEFMVKYVELASVHKSGVVVGLIRGRCGGRNPEEARRLLVDSLRRLRDPCERHDVNLLLEPLNRYETDLVNKISGALSIIGETGGWVKLLFDTFHMGIEERSLYDAILHAGSSIAHVHVAENNRLPPGMGSIDWERVVFRLLRVGYKGYLSLEAMPEPSLKEALKQTADTLKPLTASL